MVKKIDLLLLNIPFMSTAYAPAGTSLLKACVQKKGYTCKVVDSDENTIAELENYFTVNGDVSDETNELIQQYYRLICKEIVDLNPKWVGFSVFTFLCQRATTEIIKMLRQQFSGKIMIGGAGISTKGIASSNADYGDKLLNESLIDAYIKGDGDIALAKLLGGDFDYPGINGNRFALSIP